MLHIKGPLNMPIQLKTQMFGYILKPWLRKTTYRICGTQSSFNIVDERLDIYSGLKGGSGSET